MIVRNDSPRASLQTGVYHLAVLDCNFPLR